ncbi:MAG: HalOD1 output domain-containing protein [Salinigranum sp.]
MPRTTQLGIEIERNFGEPLVERPIIDSPTLALLEAAADAAIIPPGDGTVLNDYVDADSLDALVSDGPTDSPALDGAVIVTVWGHTAVVTPSKVTIYED